MTSVEDLKFIRLKASKLIRLIPIELIEAVKGLTPIPERFYEFQEANIGNPNNFLYVLIDKENKIKGYLWAQKNDFDSSLFVTAFSVAKTYWGKGEAIEKAVNFLRELKSETKVERVFWITTNE